MSFFEEQLSPKLSYGARGGPTFNTDVASSGSGFRWANKNWLMPLHRYDVSECIRSNADFEELRAFFYCVSGQFDGFRFKDWMDFTATRQNTSVLHTTGTIWQLRRAYVKGIRTFHRPIQKPVPGTGKVFDAGGAQLTATIDYTTGLANVTGTPVSWSGEFDVPVAFTSDVMEAEITTANPRDGFLITWPSVQVQEIRL